MFVPTLNLKLQKQVEKLFMTRKIVPYDFLQLRASAAIACKLKIKKFEYIKNRQKMCTAAKTDSIQMMIRDPKIYSCSVEYKSTKNIFILYFVQ